MVTASGSAESRSSESDVPAAVPLAASDLGIQLFSLADFDPTSALRKDPVNLVFGGSIGKVGAALEVVVSRLQARFDKFLGNQWFCEPPVAGPCHLQDQQRATSPVAVVRRYHLRLYQINHPGPRVTGPLTAAPIHREALDFCSDWPWSGLGRRVVDDIPDSFNAARDWAKTQFDKEPTVFAAQAVALGNVEPIVQCDGTPVQSDGLAWIIYPAGEPAPVSEPGS